MARKLPALLGLLALASSGGGCALIVYSDDLVNEETGRSTFVTRPASVAGLLGFVAGIPLDIAALPVTWLVYSAQKARYPDTADPVSTLLFPSFVLWRTCVVLVGAPLDLVEFGVYRAWARPPPPEPEEPEEAEEVPHTVEGASGA